MRMQTVYLAAETCDGESARPRGGWTSALKWSNYESFLFGLPGSRSSRAGGSRQRRQKATTESRKQMACESRHCAMSGRRARAENCFLQRLASVGTKPETNWMLAMQAIAAGKLEMNRRETRQFLSRTVTLLEVSRKQGSCKTNDREAVRCAPAKRRTGPSQRPCSISYPSVCQYVCRDVCLRPQAGAGAGVRVPAHIRLGLALITPAVALSDGLVSERRGRVAWSPPASTAEARHYTQSVGRGWDSCLDLYFACPRRLLWPECTPT